MADPYREAARQFRAMADRLDGKADREHARADFRAWWQELHRGGFSDRMAAMRLHPGLSSGDEDALIRILRDLNIKFEIDKKLSAGMSKNKAYQAVGKAALLSPERVKAIYRKHRTGGVINRPEIS